MLFEFQNKTNFEVIGLKLMNLGFAFDSSDKDLWDVDLLDTDLDLLDTNIPNQNFAFLQDVFKTCLQDILKCSNHLEDVLKTFLQDISKTSSRRFEIVLKTSWRPMTQRKIFALIKTSWRSLEDVFWRRITKPNIFVLIKWRRRREMSSERL